MTTSSLCGKPDDDESRKSWTNKDWYTHVGAWENEQGQLCFGSTMAFCAMLQQFHRVWTAAPQPPSVGDVKLYSFKGAAGRYVYEGDHREQVTARDQQIARLRLNISEMNDGAKLREEQIAELQARVSLLEPLLASMTAAYQQAINNGYDRIIFLGGECDSPERMLSDFPEYAKARAALAQQVTK